MYQWLNTYLAAIVDILQTATRDPVSPTELVYFQLGCNSIGSPMLSGFWYITTPMLEE